MDTQAYQARREQLLRLIDATREVRDELVAREQIFVNDLPADVRQRMLLLDRDATRLRNRELTVAFVGGFSAGKSSLVNAILGRYLLPESTKVTTAVPTFIRSAKDTESAEIHYLSNAEVEALGELYRDELCDVFSVPELRSAPLSELLTAIEPMASEGRGQRLLQQFKTFGEEVKRRETGPRGRVITMSISEAQEKIRNEKEAMFLDRVVLHIKHDSLPADIVLVDLPGVSVPNPRHRRVTFRFVREEAHAVVFVLMASRLFDKDEIEIMEMIRSGESRIAEKVFWVLNRWDSLSGQQQQQTLADLEAKMIEFAIPSTYQAFRTNALHGLLSQLCATGAEPSDPALMSHLRDYEDSLGSKYGASHETALRESQIPSLQAAIREFLDDRLRKTVLRSAYENACSNFCDPLLHHLRRARESDDSLVRGDLQRQEKEAMRVSVERRMDERCGQLRLALKDLRNEVAIKRNAILMERAKGFVDQLSERIQDGPETDAYQIYQEIIAERELRKYPYHFEIEMEIVDNLNTSLKQNFRRIVREQVDEVFDALVRRVDDALEAVREDIEYRTEVIAPFDDVIERVRGTFGDRVEGVTMTLAAQLDELLLFKPRGFLGLTGGNELLDGLDKAARVGFENLKNPGQPISATDFEEKTAMIRETLGQHYIAKVTEYYEQITQSVFPIVINNMQELERRLLDLMQAKYRPALEICLGKDTEGEFAVRRKGLEQRSKRLRSAIERIEATSADMAKVVGTAE